MSRRFLPALRRMDQGIEGKSLMFTGPGGIGRLSGARGGWTSVYGLENRAAGWDMNRVIRDGYERSVWVYKAVEAISGHQSRLPFRIGRDVDGDDREVKDDHPLYRVLNRQANPMETGRAFRKRLSAQVLLQKAGAFVEVTRSRVGTITRLDLLPSDRVQIMPDPNGSYIDYYQFTDWDGTIRELAPERVKWIREPHPTDPFSGTTPLEAAGMSVELDQLSRLYNVTFIQNDARPGGIVGVDADSLDDQMLDRIERKLGKGAHRAGEVAIVGTGPGGLNYVDTTTRPRDMAYGEAAANAKLEILIAFGVPESVIGSASGKTFDNAEQEGFNFWSETMLPHLDLIASAFDEDVDDEWDPFLDTASVQVLELPRRQARAEALGEFNAGLRSANEYRPLADLDPVDNAQARALWMSPQKAPVPTRPEDADELGVGGGDGAAPAAGAPVTGPTAADAVREARDAVAQQAGGAAAGALLEARALDGAAAPDAGSAADALAQARAFATESEPGEAAAAVRAAKLEGKAAPGQLDEYDDGEDEQDAAPTRAGVPPVSYDGGDARQQHAELAIAAALSALLARQLGVLSSRLESPKARKGTRFWNATDATDTRGGDDDIDLVKVTSPDRWAQDAADTVQPLAQSSSTQAGADLLRSLAAAGVIATAGAVPTEAGEYAGEAAAAAAPVVFGAVVHAEAAMRAWLVDVAEELHGILATATDMTTVTRELRAFYGRRAESFTRSLATELATGLINGAEEAAVKSLTPLPGSRDAVVVRAWVSRRDEQVRPAHRQLDDGARLPVGTPFLVDGARLRWPGDPLAPAALVRNCRCRLTYSVAPDAQFITEPAQA